MLGAIIGDIVGSTYEFHPIKTKKFDLFPDGCGLTDDSILTIALRNAVSLGGDADTQACIAGSIAEAMFGIPTELLERSHSFLVPEMAAICVEFDSAVALARPNDNAYRDSSVSVTS